MENAHSVQFIGIGPWKLIADEPRHNTFHMELHRISRQNEIELIYLGLKDDNKQEWMNQIIPLSVTKKYTYLSPTSLNRIAQELREYSDKTKIFYIFEGSISWLITLNLLANRIGNSKVICNLFSSGKYDVILFQNGLKSWYFKMVIKNLWRIVGKNSILTFDTKLMAEKVIKLLDIPIVAFPVPSSFEYKNKNAMYKAHYKVLLNLRGFDATKLHGYLENSCPYCIFTVPKGLITSGQIAIKSFEHFKNIRFDDFNIPEKDYATYIDSFDYLIILYEPSINASGKILDAITRNVAVALPREAEEWSNIARNWGRSHLYSWGSAKEEELLFQHPLFTDPINSVEPPFTPRNSLKQLVSISDGVSSTKKKEKDFSFIFNQISSFVYFVFCLSSNLLHLTKVKMSLLFQKLVRSLRK